MAIKLSEVFEFINKMAAEQQDPGSQAMAAAAQAATPPGGIPLPKPIEQPKEEGGENMVPEEKLQAEKEKLEEQRRAELEKKENEIRGLQHELDLERVERQKATAENELKEKSRQQEEKLKQEREKLDAERQKLEQDKAMQSNTQQAELIKHQADMERETSKQVADIAQQKAKAIEDIAKQNAQQYVKTTQQAQQQTNRYFADQQKKFKEDNPTMSTALQNQINNAVSATKSVISHHKKIASYIPVPGGSPIKKKASSYESFDPNRDAGVNSTSTTQPTQPTQPAQQDQQSNTSGDPGVAPGPYSDFDPGRFRVNTPAQQTPSAVQPTTTTTQGSRRPVYRMKVDTPNPYNAGASFSPSRLGLSVTRDFFESPERISELASKYQYTNPLINQSLQYSYDKRAVYLAAAYNAMQNIAASNPQIKDSYAGKEQRDVNLDVHLKMLKDYMKDNPKWKDEFTTAFKHLDDEVAATEKDKKLLTGDRALRNSIARYRLLSERRMTPVGETSLRDVDRRNKMRTDEASRKVESITAALNQAKETGDTAQVRQLEGQLAQANAELLGAYREGDLRLRDEIMGRTSIPISKLDILMNGGKSISRDMEDTRDDLPDAEYYKSRSRWGGPRRALNGSLVERGVDAGLVGLLGGLTGWGARATGWGARALGAKDTGDSISEFGKTLTSAAGDSLEALVDWDKKTQGFTSSIVGEGVDVADRLLGGFSGRLSDDHREDGLFNGTAQNYENNKRFNEILDSYDLTEDEKKAIREDLDIPESALMEALTTGSLDAAEAALLLMSGGAVSTLAKAGGKAAFKVAPSLAKLPLVERSIKALSNFRKAHPWQAGAYGGMADTAAWMSLPTNDRHPFITEGQGQLISYDSSNWLNKSNNMDYDPVKGEYSSKPSNNKVAPYYGVYDRLSSEKLDSIASYLENLLAEDKQARSYSPLRLQYDAINRVRRERARRAEAERAESLEGARARGDSLYVGHPSDTTLSITPEALEKSSSADNIYRGTARGRNIGWGYDQLFSPYYNYNRYRQNWLMNKLESAAPWIKMLTGGAIDLNPDLSSMVRQPKEPIDPVEMAGVVLNPANDPTLRTRSGPVSNAYANLTSALRYKAGFDTPKQTTIPNAGSNLYSTPKVN